MTPKISVITLSYNRPKWLREAIESIEYQTHQTYEHLVYDNGSSDPEVLSVLRAAKERRPDKFFYCQPGFPPRDMVGLHWNILLGLSRGEYITILDDDNRKRPDFFDKMSGPMDFDRQIEAVTCGWQPIDENGFISGEDIHKNKTTSISNLFMDNTVDSNAVMFRRSVLDKVGHFSGVTTLEDWHFMIRLVKRCRVEHLDDVLLQYRVHPHARSKRAPTLGASEDADRIRAGLFTAEETRQALRDLKALRFPEKS